LNGGINTYSYVYSNPLTLVDRVGLSACSCLALARASTPDGNKWNARRFNKSGKLEVYRFGRWNSTFEVDGDVAFDFFASNIVSTGGAIVGTSIYVRAAGVVKNIWSLSGAGTAFSVIASGIYTGYQGTREYEQHLSNSYTPKVIEIIRQFSDSYAFCLRESAGGVNE
jgi:hypothetical protein